MDNMDIYMIKNCIYAKIIKLDKEDMDYYEKREKIRQDVYDFIDKFGIEMDDNEIDKIISDNLVQDNFDAKMIEAPGYHPWLEGKKNQIEWHHRDAYHQFLFKNKNWDSKTVADIDRYSDIIIDHIADPVEKSFNKKGLVIGDIQSGKTASYTDVINKAIDVGYKLIIVLAGVHNDLRAQTQSRLDKEVLGYDTKINTTNTKVRIGVGEIAHNIIDVQALTHNEKDGDFKSDFTFLIKEPTIAIVKKNSTVLKRFLKLLDNNSKIFSGGKLEIPTLIIDDEVDQASVNTKKEEAPAAINGLIRKIINKIDRISYVGYTATPYANILINYDPSNSDSVYGHDLFPKDFIIVLPTSSNYCGVKEFFGDRENPNYDLIKIVEDEKMLVTEQVTEDGLLRFKAQSEITNINKSIKDAIDDFIVASAVHRSREGKCHNGMMVHIAAYKKPSTTLKELIDDYIYNLKDKYRFDEFEKDRYKKIWEERFKNISLERGREDKWEDIEKELPNVFEIMKVKLLNGDSKDIINYSNLEESEIIAVGGSKLSRGITIEGLMISYYLRTPNAYDTAMQMGRWFGYKKNYIDLCRIYTKKQMAEDFIYIFDANMELRKDIDSMNSKELNPTNFGLKIKLHPTMKPTSGSKMRNGEIQKVSFSEQRQETIHFDMKEKQNNLNITRKFINNLKEEYNYSVEDNRPIFRNVSSSKIIEYLNEYKYPQFLDYDLSKQWKKYIENLNEDGELVNWTVLVSSLNKVDEENEIDIGGFKVYKANRKSFPRDIEFTRVISAPQDFKYFFEKDDPYREKYKTGYKKNDAELQSLFNEKNAILSIYPVDIYDPQSDLIEKNVIGFAIWFPNTKNQKCANYVVDSVYLRADNNIDELDYEEDIDD